MRSPFTRPRHTVGTATVVAMLIGAAGCGVDHEAAQPSTTRPPTTSSTATTYPEVQLDNEGVASGTEPPASTQPPAPEVEGAGGDHSSEGGGFPPRMIARVTYLPPGFELEEEGDNPILVGFGQGFSGPGGDTMLVVSSTQMRELGLTQEYLRELTLDPATTLFPGTVPEDVKIDGFDAELWMGPDRQNTGVSMLRWFGADQMYYFVQYASEAGGGAEIAEEMLKVARGLRYSER